MTSHTLTQTLTPALCLAAAIGVLPAAAAAPAVTDAQIAAIVVTANQVDIDAGTLAADRAGTAEVKAFARLMVTDHGGVNAAAVDLVTRLKVTPQDNPTAQALKAGGAKNVAHLKTLRGAAFDRAYVEQEVTYHAAVLDALDTVLIPNASQADLKALLVKVRPAFVAHLEHARRLQASLGGGKGARVGAPTPAAHTVVIDATRYQPARLAVHVGDTIEWVNRDVIPHTATAVTGAFDSRPLAAGASWRFTVEASGATDYACRFHPAMTGRIEAE